MANRIMDEFCGSKFWDWNRTWFTDDIPEFTPCFEETILIWVPCLFLFSFFIFDFRQSYNNEFSDIPWGWLNTSKLIGVGGLFFLAFLDLTYAYLWHPVHLIMHSVDYCSAIIKLIAFSMVGILIDVHRRNGVRTSGFLFCFWLILVLCNFPHYVTQIRKSVLDSNHIEYNFYLYVSNIIYFPLIVSMLIFELFVDSTPLYSKYKTKKNPAPCTNTSFINATFALWFDSYALKFYRTTLQTKDLWNLKYQQTTDYLVPLFYKYWNLSVSANRKKSNAYLSRKYGYKFDQINAYEDNGTRTLFDRQYRKQSKRIRYEKLIRRRLGTALKYSISIIPILWKEFKMEYITATCTKVFSDGLLFVSPLTLSLLINYEENDEPTWRGYLYTILLVLVPLLQTALLNYYISKMLSSGLCIRSTLMSVIYRKVLKVSNNVKKEFTSGDISNLMSVDAQRFYDSNLYLNSGVASPLIIALSLFFLWRLIGYSAFAGVAIMLMMIPFNMVAANKVKELQSKQMKLKDERIKITSEVFLGIKTLKMYAWEESFERRILAIRNDEIRTLRRIAYLSTIISFFLVNIPYLVSLATFAVYTLADEKNILTTEIAFVSLALINVMKQPISLLPRIIINLIQTAVATKRINKFLNIEELDPFDITHDKMERCPLVIENGKFTWNGEDGDDDDDEAVNCLLNDINLRVENGSLVAVVGTVGCGKSSLLSALLGEMKRLDGRVNTNGSIAYVPQQAWLQNATLRDNILFTSAYNVEIYDKVVESCALTPDFHTLLAGDQTEIGEKGINLSGGQKQRISLARSVYNNADIYLLDDPLSAVDAHVGRHIFNNVIGPKGLLRNKTRVLVTHSINFLPETDLIVVMKNGTIAECDTYDRLMSKEDGEFRNFITNFTHNANESAEESISDVIGDGHVDFAFKSKQDILNDRQLYFRSLSEEFPPLLSEEPIVIESILDEGDLSREEEHSQRKLSNKETVQEGKIKLSVYAYYVKSGGVVLWITCLLFNTIYQALMTGANMWLSTWSTAASRGNDSRIFYLEVYALFGIGQLVGVILLTVTMYLATINASAYLHQQLLSKTLRWPSSLFDVTPIGYVLNRLSFDLDVLDNVFPVALRQFFILVGTVITTLYVISYSNPLFILFIIPLVLIYVFLQQMYISTQRQLKRLEAVSRAPVYSLFNEAISGSSVIRAFGMQNHFIGELDRRIYENQLRTYPSIEAQKWIGLRLDLLGDIILFLTALLAVLGRHVVDSGMVSLAITYSMQIMSSLNWTIRTWSDIETNIVSVERIKDIEKTPQEQSTTASAIECVSVTPQMWPTKGEIVFENYQMRYREGLDLVLRGVNIKIKSGEKIGIVGRTGSGKSSMTLSLFRIVEAASGRILIDGIDISTVDLTKLRSKITIIPQDPVLFSGTIRFNLDPFFEYSDHELWHALEIAYLKNYIQSLPSGLDHLVFESGDNLSIGQRQLMCLARALLRKTKILVMDEATAAIDLETDQLIQTTIKKEFKSCTVLTIAHKLNTIIDSDRIIVLEDGRVKEFDTPDTLLTLQPRTTFYEMAKEANLIS